MADAGSFADDTVMSDASPDPIIPWAQYAQTRIDIDTSALTGIQRVDDTTVKLTATLAYVMDTVEYLPRMTAQQHGTAVHLAFGAAVRLGKFPGIGFWDVETTFVGNGEEGTHGEKGSIRTDVVLRNEAGEIVMIYDAKSGKSGLSARRVREIRARTGAGPNVPIIEMHVIRGLSRKRVVARLEYQDFRSR